jgi:hypothetical protein
MLRTLFGDSTMTSVVKDSLFADRGVDGAYANASRQETGHQGADVRRYDGPVPALEVPISSKVNEERKAIFVHVPKNAGLSVARVLKKAGYRDPGYGWVDHDFAMTWRAGECQRVIAEVGRELWDDCFTFAFVRNPWDRLVSGWKITREWGKHELSFPEFVRQLPSLDPDQPPEALRRAISTHWHAMPQTDHLLVDGEIAVDFIGRVETIDDDWRSLADRIGCDATLPRINTSDHGHYRDYYDDELLAIVDDTFRRDLDVLDYTF